MDKAVAPIRVLSLIKGLGPGGAEHLLLSLARMSDGSDRDRYEHECAYLLPWKDALAPALEAAGVRVTCLRGGREFDVRWAWRFRQLLRRGRYDVVHVHSPYVAGVGRLVVRSLPARARPRVVSTEHNDWTSHARLTRLLNRWTFPLGDRWLAVSAAVRDSVSAAVRDRVEVVVHGVLVDEVGDHRRSRARVRAELGIALDEVAVVTVSNLRRQKDYPTLLAAARRVLDDGLPVRFFAVGQGPLASELQHLSDSLQLGDRFVFLGYRDDVPRVLAAGDIFALASRYEGFPIALVEALVSGLPVVATAVGGVPDAIRDGVDGLLVPPSRPDLLAAALGRLVVDDQLRSRAARSAAERGRGYDLSAAARRLEAIYRECAAASADARRVPSA